MERIRKIIYFKNYFSDFFDQQSEKVKEKIFQPFFSTKGYEAGRGLGLSGVYSVIKEHKGTIRVLQSAPGQGTSFEIMLPSHQKTEMIIKKPEEADGYVGYVKILWVDDEQILLNLAEKIIKHLGYKADFINSGEQALKYLAKNKYDLVITDIGMPDMNGWQLADKIKEQYKGTKVAVISGWGAEISDEEKEKHGVSYVLGKPVQINEIKELIARAMQS